MLWQRNRRARNRATISAKAGTGENSKLDDAERGMRNLEDGMRRRQRRERERKGKESSSHGQVIVRSCLPRSFGILGVTRGRARRVEKAGSGRQPQSFRLWESSSHTYDRRRMKWLVLPARATRGGCNRDMGCAYEEDLTSRLDCLKPTVITVSSAATRG